MADLDSLVEQVALAIHDETVQCQHKALGWECREFARAALSAALPLLAQMVERMDTYTPGGDVGLDMAADFLSNLARDLAGRDEMGAS